MSSSNAGQKHEGSCSLLIRDLNQKAFFTDIFLTWESTGGLVPPHVPLSHGSKPACIINTPALPLLGGLQMSAMRIADNSVTCAQDLEDVALFFVCLFYTS